LQHLELAEDATPLISFRIDKLRIPSLLQAVNLSFVAAVREWQIVSFGAALTLRPREIV